MFKFLFNNILSILFIASIVALVGCNGNKTKHDALKESIVKFKDSIKPTKIVEYVPKEYSEIRTDTILSNGFRVNIKLFTDMEHNVVNEYKVGSIHYKENYRVIKADITVLKSNKEIFNKTIDKTFLEVDSSYKNYLKTANITGAYLDEFASINKNKVVINIPISKFNKSINPTYNIIIDDKGAYSIQLFKIS